MKTRLLLVLITLAVGTNVTFAQAPFERLGQKALTGGDFRAAASYFEKAYSSDHSNMDALWLLGYASYHAADYSKSVNAFDKLISMKPAETAAYYYRGKAKLLWSSTMKDYKSIHRERLLLGAIHDFSSALDLTPGDYKLFQNRGLAYQQYAQFKNQRVADVYDRSAVVSACNSSIADFQKILDESGYRRDISAQIEKSKQLLVNIIK